MYTIQDQLEMESVAESMLEQSFGTCAHQLLYLGPCDYIIVDPDMFFVILRAQYNLEYHFWCVAGL